MRYLILLNKSCTFAEKVTMIIPYICPACQNQLKVKSLKCEVCSTEVSGMFELPVLARLSPNDQQFIIQFVRSSGSFKDMTKHLKLSYPTVRNMLDDVIGRLQAEEAKTQQMKPF